MIAVRGLDLPGRDLRLSFRRPPLSHRSGRPLLIGIGDPVAGPLVGLFFDAPPTPEQLAAGPDLAPAHSHPCDNFRVVMKGELWVGQERYHHGEFRLQRSGRPYGSDGDAPHQDGNWRIITFADRRGHRVRPTNPDLRRQYASEETIARLKADLGDLVPEILPDADDGVNGLVTTVDRPFSRLGHIDCSFAEAGTWEPLPTGGRVAVSLMGVHDVGPVVIVQRTPPDRLATPAGIFDSDVFRCVIAGGGDLRGERLEMGDTVLRPAGALWEEVRSGPQGLDEVIIIGDRRGAVPQVAGSDATWALTLDRILGRLQVGLAELVPA